jgi:hypothetical protein
MKTIVSKIRHYTELWAMAWIVGCIIGCVVIIPPIVFIMCSHLIFGGMIGHILGLSGAAAYIIGVISLLEHWPKATINPEITDKK